MSSYQEVQSLRASPRANPASEGNRRASFGTSGWISQVLRSKGLFARVNHLGSLSQDSIRRVAHTRCGCIPSQVLLMAKMDLDESFPRLARERSKRSRTRTTPLDPMVTRSFWVSAATGFAIGRSEARSTSLVQTESASCYRSTPAHTTTSSRRQELASLPFGGCFMSCLSAPRQSRQRMQSGMVHARARSTS